MSDHHPLADFLFKLERFAANGYDIELQSSFLDTDACFEEVKRICRLKPGERNRLRNFIFPPGKIFKFCTTSPHSHYLTLTQNTYGNSDNLLHHLTHSTS
jgi:hypothetical protein